MLKFLHLVPDEKFIDMFFATMGRVPDCENTYVADLAEGGERPRHIKRTTPLKLVGGDYFSSREMIDDLSAADVLVVHYLTPHAMRMIAAAPERMVVVWSGWGADYYNIHPTGNEYLLEDSSKKIAAELYKSWSSSSLVALVKRSLRSVKFRAVYGWRIAPAIRRADFFSAPIPEDYAVAQRLFGRDFRADYVQLIYGTMETYGAGLVNPQGRNILVGNSAQITNNHVEVFEKLSRMNLDGRDVVVPLSYGDMIYRDHVLAAGKRLLGERFRPIMDFMPLGDYNALIASCSCAMMNYHRQQGSCSIGTLLLSGSRVYMNPVNPLYQFFHARGAVFENIARLETPWAGMFDKVSEDERAINEKVLRDFWEIDRVDTYFRDFIVDVRRRLERRAG